jgi:uncharacterized RDD family membrane protein YckC
MEHNPYAPTKAALNEKLAVDDDAGGIDGMRLASRGRRITNLTIDDIVYYLIIAAVLVPIGVAVGAETLTQYFLDMSFVTRWLLFGVVRVGYYFLCEATTGRTVGKLVSGTRVVTESGGKPTTLQILQRTLSRMVPFEPFSFFGPSTGWHDRWSKTRVVLAR